MLLHISTIKLHLVIYILHQIFFTRTVNASTMIRIYIDIYSNLNIQEIPLKFCSLSDFLNYKIKV